MKRISIVIPAYNEERFIEDCLNSVYQQASADYCLNIEGTNILFFSSYGEKCDPKSVQDIAEKLKKMISLYEDYSIDGIYLRENFDWDIVADKYLAIMELDKNNTKL